MLPIGYSGNDGCEGPACSLFLGCTSPKHLDCPSCVFCYFCCQIQRRKKPEKGQYINRSPMAVHLGEFFSFCTLRKYFQVKKSNTSSYSLKKKKKRKEIHMHETCPRRHSVCGWPKFISDHPLAVGSITVH